jgi:hypothetical protein
MQKNDNLKIVFNEVVELHQYQQQSLDLMYNKLNWILVADFVFLASLYSAKHLYAFVVFLVSISVTAALIGFAPKQYRYTARISKQLADVKENNFSLEHLINKKRDAFLKNSSESKKVECCLKISQYTLLVAVWVQLLFYIFS